MANDDPIRASDVDREAVVTTLRDAYTAGRLTLDEFDERMTGAYAAKNWGDLRALTADLPIQPLLGTDLPEHLQPVDQAANIAAAPGALVPGQENTDPAQQPDAPLPQHRRRRPMVFLIPLAFWALLVLSGNPSDGGAALVVIVFLMVAFVTAAFRR